MPYSRGSPLWSNPEEFYIVYKFSTLTRAEIEAMFTLDELRSTRYFQEVAAAEREKGREEGRELGLEQGLEQGLITSIVEVLETRFGNQAMDVETNLRQITDVAQLRQVLKKAVQASSLNKFQEWLTQAL